MKRVFLSILASIILAASAAAQLPVCNVAAQIYDVKGQPRANFTIRVVRVVKNAQLISNNTEPYTTNAAGQVTIPLPQGSTAWVYANAYGLDSKGTAGVPLTIPSASSAQLETLVQLTGVFTALTDIFTTLGDTVYGGSGGVATRLPGSTEANLKFIGQLGTGSASAAPAWYKPVAGSNVSFSFDHSAKTWTINSTGGGGGGSLTTREVDGSPSITTSALEFAQADGFVLTDQSGGVARLSITGIPWANVSKSGSSLADLATRSASDLSSGTLPDGRFPSTLPVVSGANLTNLSASNISSGTLPAARGGTGQTSATNNGALIADGSAFVLSVIPNCNNGTTDKLLYNNSTRAFSCGSDQTGAGGSGIATLNTLTATTQTLSKVDDTNVTLTITSTTDNHEFALGWTGTLAKSRQHANTVYTDQANTFGNFVQTFQAGSNHLLVDPSDTSKRFQFDASNIATATTRMVNIPNANSTTVQASSAPSNQFANAISAQGVVSYAQPSFSNLSGTASAAQIQEVIALADLTDVTAKTGSGATVVMSTSPSLTTPTLGVASATSITVGNTGLLAQDTNASHTLNFRPGSNITANRTLTFTTGDADRTVTLNADTTLSGTNTGDQTITLTNDVTGSGTGSFATTIANNAVSDAKFRQSAGLSVIGRSANSTGNVADITAANDGEVLRRSGTSIGFGAVANSALDSDLQALGDNSTSGFWARTGAGTGAARTITGTANQIVIANGNGGSGDPTIDVGSQIVQTDQANTWSTGAQDFGSATSLKIPVASGAAPTTEGQMAVNSTTHVGVIGINGATVEFTGYDVAGFVVSKPGSSQVALRFVAPRAFNLPTGTISNGTNANVKAATAATAQTEFALSKNGAAAFCTLRFAASGTQATYQSCTATDFAAGDVLTITAPSTQDATLADIGFTLPGKLK